jgi:hypothetical protein
MTGQRLRRTRRAPRDEFTTEIFADLCEVTPETVIPMPDPYNDNIPLKQNIANLFYQLRWSLRTDRRIEGLVAAYYLGQHLEQRCFTPAQKRECRKMLTTHYILCCIRIYDLFSIQGIEQIYRTKRVFFWMFRAIKRQDFVRLTREAEDLYSV